MIEAPHCQHAISTTTALLTGQCPHCLLSLGLGAEDDLTAVRTEGVDSSEQDRYTPGAIVSDRFRITAYIGRGGMGEVYRADDVKLGQAVALKFLPRDRPSEYAVRLFYDEVRLGRQVAHPSVCRLYDLLEVDGRPFIVMEFVDGEDLASVLRRLGRLNYRKAIDVARDICAGLEAAHERGIIHGDLKPANIMIDGRGRARITDFGLARVIDEQNRRAGQLIGGTLTYMAPEQFATNEITRRTDLYSLGLVLYEMFTGHRARDAADPAELDKSFQTSLIRPSVYRPHIEQPIEEMILRCLATDPQHRPESARTVLAALPGGDPVDAMVRAGETPSPEYVAASRKISHLSTAQAWSTFAASLVCVSVLMVLSGSLTLYARAHLASPPSRLASRARELVRDLAAIGAIADDGYWFESNLAYLHRKNSHFASELFPPILFHYRASASALAPLAADGRLRSDDPPLQGPGTAHLVLSPSGRLLRLEAVPLSAPQPAATFSWNQIMRHAGVTLADLVPDATSWTPPVPYDEKRQWRMEPAVVRAARYGRHLTYFEISDPDTPLPVASFRGAQLPNITYMVLLACALSAGAYLARRNLSSGSVDRRGSFRIAAGVFACRAMFGLVAGHHPMSIEKEPAYLFALAGSSLTVAAEVWLAYAALEPYVRGRWPELMIGWVRLGRGRFRDPVVGRDLQVGALVGVILRLLDQLRNIVPLYVPWLHAIPSHLAVEELGATRETVAAIFYYASRAIYLALFGLFLLLLLRMLLRTDWLAATVWLTTMTATWSRWDDQRLGIPIVAVQMIVVLVTLRRFSLLSATAALFVFLLTIYAPLTFDPSRFYFLQSTIAVSAVIALILYALYCSRAGKGVPRQVEGAVPTP